MTNWRDQAVSLGKQVGYAVKEGAKDVWADIFTNERKDKGILDYDKYTAYNKQLSSPYISEAEKQRISSKMIDENVIDPNKYNQFNKTQAEYLKSIQIEPENKKREQAYQNIKDQYNQQLTDLTTDFYKTGTDFDRKRIEKSVERMQKEFDSVTGYIKETYGDKYAVPETTIKKYDEWRKGTMEFYKDYINNMKAGMSDADAYNQAINKDKARATKLADLQFQIKDENFRYGQKALDKDEDVGLITKLFLSFNNQVSRALNKAGGWVESGKQMLGDYEGLEELKYLGVYKDTDSALSKFGQKTRSTLFQIYDAAPSFVPEVVTTVIADRGLTKIARAEQLINTISKTGMSAKNATRIANFTTEMVKDTMLFDAIAQASVGSANTAETIGENFLFNLPFNSALGYFAHGQKQLVQNMSNQFFQTPYFSKETLSLIGKEDANTIKKSIIMDMVEYANNEKLLFQGKITQKEYDAFLNNRVKWNSEKFSNMVDVYGKDADGFVSALKSSQEEKLLLDTKKADFETVSNWKTIRDGVTSGSIYKTGSNRIEHLSTAKQQIDNLLLSKENFVKNFKNDLLSQNVQIMAGIRDLAIIAKDPDTFKNNIKNTLGSKEAAMFDVLMYNDITKLSKAQGYNAQKLNKKLKEFLKFDALQEVPALKEGDTIGLFKVKDGELKHIMDDININDIDPKTIKMRGYVHNTAVLNGIKNWDNLNNSSKYELLKTIGLVKDVDNSGYDKGLRTLTKNILEKHGIKIYNETVSGTAVTKVKASKESIEGLVNAIQRIQEGDFLFKNIDEKDVSAYLLVFINDVLNYNTYWKDKGLKEVETLFETMFKLHSSDEGGASILKGNYVEHIQKIAEAINEGNFKQAEMNSAKLIIDTTLSGAETPRHLEHILKRYDKSPLSVPEVIEDIQEVLTLPLYVKEIKEEILALPLYKNRKEIMKDTINEVSEAKKEAIANCITNYQHIPNNIKLKQVRSKLLEIEELTALKKRLAEQGALEPGSEASMKINKQIREANIDLVDIALENDILDAIRKYTELKTDLNDKIMSSYINKNKDKIFYNLQDYYTLYFNKDDKLRKFIIDNPIKRIGDVAEEDLESYSKYFALRILRGSEIETDISVSTMHKLAKEIEQQFRFIKAIDADIIIKFGKRFSYNPILKTITISVHPKHAKEILLNTKEIKRVLTHERLHHELQYGSKGVISRYFKKINELVKQVSTGEVQDFFQSYTKDPDRIKNLINQKFGSKSIDNFIDTLYDFYAIEDPTGINFINFRKLLNNETLEEMVVELVASGEKVPKELKQIIDKIDLISQNKAIIAEAAEILLLARASGSKIMSKESFKEKMVKELLPKRKIITTTKKKPAKDVEKKTVEEFVEESVNIINSKKDKPLTNSLKYSKTPEEQDINSSMVKLILSKYPDKLSNTITIAKLGDVAGFNVFQDIRNILYSIKTKNKDIPLSDVIVSNDLLKQYDMYKEGFEGSLKEVDLPEGMSYKDAFFYGVIDNPLLTREQYIANDILNRVLARTGLLSEEYIEELNKKITIEVAERLQQQFKNGSYDKDQLYKKVIYKLQELDLPIPEKEKSLKKIIDEKLGSPIEQYIYYKYVNPNLALADASEKQIGTVLLEALQIENANKGNVSYLGEVASDFFDEGREGLFTMGFSLVDDIVMKEARKSHMEYFIPFVKDPEDIAGYLSYNQHLIASTLSNEEHKELLSLINKGDQYSKYGTTKQKKYQTAKTQLARTEVTRVNQLTPFSYKEIFDEHGFSIPIKGAEQKITITGEVYNKFKKAKADKTITLYPSSKKNYGLLLRTIMMNDMELEFSFKDMKGKLASYKYPKSTFWQSPLGRDMVIDYYKNIQPDLQVIPTMHSWMDSYPIVTYHLYKEKHNIENALAKAEDSEASKIKSKLYSIQSDINKINVNFEYNILGIKSTGTYFNPSSLLHKEIDNIVYGLPNWLKGKKLEINSLICTATETIINSEGEKEVVDYRSVDINDLFDTNHFLESSKGEDITSNISFNREELTVFAKDVETGEEYYFTANAAGDGKLKFIKDSSFIDDIMEQDEILKPAVEDSSSEKKIVNESTGIYRIVPEKKEDFIHSLPYKQREDIKYGGTKTTKDARELSEGMIERVTSQESDKIDEILYGPGGRGNGAVSTPGNVANDFMKQIEENNKSALSIENKRLKSYTTLTRGDLAHSDETLTVMIGGETISIGSIKELLGKNEIFLNKHGQFITDIQVKANQIEKLMNSQDFDTLLSKLGQEYKRTNGKAQLTEGMKNYIPSYVENNEVIEEFIDDLEVLGNIFEMSGYGRDVLLRYNNKKALSKIGEDVMGSLKLEIMSEFPGKRINEIKDSLVNSAMQQFGYNEKKAKRLVRDLFSDGLGGGMIHKLVSNLRGAYRILKYSPLSLASGGLLFLNNTLVGSGLYLSRRRGLENILNHEVIDAILETGLLKSETIDNHLIETLKDTGEFGEGILTKIEKGFDVLPLLTDKQKAILKSTNLGGIHTLFDIIASKEVNRLSIAQAIGRSGVNLENLDIILRDIKLNGINPNRHFRKNIIGDALAFRRDFFTNSRQSVLGRNRFSNRVLFTNMQSYSIARMDELISAILRFKDDFGVKFRTLPEFADYINTDNLELKGVINNIILSAKLGYYLDVVSGGNEDNNERRMAYVKGLNEYFSAGEVAFFNQILMAPIKGASDYIKYSKLTDKPMTLVDGIEVTTFETLSKAMGLLFREGKILDTVINPVVAYGKTGDWDFSVDVLSDTLKKVSEGLGRFNMLPGMETFGLKKIDQIQDPIGQLLLNLNESNKSVETFQDITSYQNIDALLNNNENPIIKAIMYMPIAGQFLKAGLGKGGFGFNEVVLSKMQRMVKEDGALTKIWNGEFPVEMLEDSNITNRLYQELTTQDFTRLQYKGKGLHVNNYGLNEMKDIVFTKNMVDKVFGGDIGKFEQVLSQFEKGNDKGLLKIMAIADANEPGSSKTVLSYLASRMQKDIIKEIGGDKYISYRDIDEETQTNIQRIIVEKLYPYMNIADKTSWYKLAQERFEQLEPTIMKGLANDAKLNKFVNSLAYVDMLTEHLADTGDINAKKIKNIFTVVGKYTTDPDVRLRLIQYAMDTVEDSRMAKSEKIATRMGMLLGNMDFYANIKKDPILSETYKDDLNKFEHIVRGVSSDLNQYGSELLTEELRGKDKAQYQGTKGYSYNKSRYYPDNDRNYGNNKSAKKEFENRVNKDFNPYTSGMDYTPIRVQTIPSTRYSPQVLTSKPYNAYRYYKEQQGGGKSKNLTAGNYRKYPGQILANLKYSEAGYTAGRIKAKPTQFKRGKSVIVSKGVRKDLPGG